MPASNAFASTGVTYILDGVDRIVSVGAGWDEFALANFAPRATASFVIGTTLWQHISDASLRHLLRKLFAAVRATGKPTQLSCRCDAPHSAREMRFELCPTGSGMLTATNTITSEHPHVAVAIALDEPELLRMCSWCNRFKLGADWVELEDAVNRRQMLHEHRPIDITHTLCSACAEKLERASEDSAQT